ncbi:uncharacterized protein G2W53_014187 [Senna tora]|uniref:Uncharacterized protein n=1 Tax=Senna tora TaxID=362788 RepID=A0A835C3R4_9FABA|nr:uncharacterized protein G2W53_014187 [Senna tora]
MGPVKPKAPCGTLRLRGLLGGEGGVGLGEDGGYEGVGFVVGAGGEAFR